MRDFVPGIKASQQRAGIPITAIVVIIALELAGFVGALLLRHRPHTK
jgi:hypothetical protein